MYSAYIRPRGQGQEDLSVFSLFLINSCKNLSLLKVRRLLFFVAGSGLKNMGVKVATTCLQWSKSPIVPQSPSSSQTLASAISSPSSIRRSFSSGSTRMEVYRYVQRLDRSTSLFVPQFMSGINRTRSMRRSCSASSDAFRFQLSDDDDGNNEINHHRNSNNNNAVNSGGVDNSFVVEPPWQEKPPDWYERDDETVLESIERKANSVDLPLSLRIIKRKLQWRDGFREAGESAYCSMKKAFSSMVFIIRELQSFTLQMREILFYEDLKANFTVHSMSCNAAIAAAEYRSTPTAETASVVEFEDNKQKNFDPSPIKTFSVLSSSSGKTTSIGGNNGGGGKFRPFTSGTDGDGGFDRIDQFRTYVPDGASSQLSSLGTTREAESVSGQVEREEDLTQWNLILDEASNMQASLRDGTLDHEIMKKLVAPVRANIESDDYTDYFKTELLYQTGLSQEPNNPLLLSNYAQFLYLVAHDYDRAEVYFKKAIGVVEEAADAEAYSKYAKFLWRVRNDLWAAEETFLEAISADPTNPHYAADYANFLWNTGGEDTCFPLSSPDDATQEA
ncbi:hypothetical protein QYF36_002878 [Acer negundo]|nr:hypothetical protein QYF36_002878 [Acer negundo]